MTTTDALLKALADVGLRADYGYHVPEVIVSLDGAYLLLSRGHNVSGWEAAIELLGRDQVGLEDGPPADAPAADVAAWVRRLIAGGCRPHDEPQAPAAADTDPVSP